MAEFSQLVELLRQVLAEPAKLPTLIPKFQHYQGATVTL